MSQGSPAEDIAALLHSGFRYALSLTHNEAHAEDILQDAWYAVLHAGGPHNKPYLFTAIRARFLNQRKRDLLVPLVPLEEMAEQDYAYDDSELLQVAYDNKALQNALATLRAAERETLFLTAVEGYTAQEIANLTQQPRGSILSLIHRAKNKLKKFITLEYPEVLP